MLATWSSFVWNVHEALGKNHQSWTRRRSVSLVWQQDTGSHGAGVMSHNCFENEVPDALCTCANHIFAVAGSIRKWIEHRTITSHLAP